MFKKIIFPVLFFTLLLLGANLWAFVKSIQYGDNLLKIEKEIKKIKIENEELKKELSLLDTLDYTASLAAEMGLDYPLKFWYFQSAQYARSY